MTVLVDSDILIEVSRGRDTAIVSRWIELSRSDAGVCYSAISVAELWAGARPSEHEDIERLFKALTCIPVDAETGRVAGDYLRRFRKSHGIDLGDALVAAAALVSHAALWTRNRKHYPMTELSFF